MKMNKMFVLAFSVIATAGHATCPPPGTLQDIENNGYSLVDNLPQLDSKGHTFEIMDGKYAGKKQKILANEKTPTGELNPLHGMVLRPTEKYEQEASENIEKDGFCLFEDAEEKKFLFQKKRKCRASGTQEQLETNGYFFIDSPDLKDKGYTFKVVDGEGIGKKRQIVANEEEPKGEVQFVSQLEIDPQQPYEKLYAKSLSRKDGFCLYQDDQYKQYLYQKDI